MVLSQFTAKVTLNAGTISVLPANWNSRCGW
jgi:hypothetical protein